MSYYSVIIIDSESEDEGTQTATATTKTKKKKPRIIQSGNRKIYICFQKLCLCLSDTEDDEIDNTAHPTSNASDAASTIVSPSSRSTSPSVLNSRENSPSRCGSRSTSRSSSPVTSRSGATSPQPWHDTCRPLSSQAPETPRTPDAMYSPPEVIEESNIPIKPLPMH